MAPTWVSPHGFVGTLDHIFLRSPSEGAHATEMRSDSSFPSNHLPVVVPSMACPPRLNPYARQREAVF